MSTMKNNVRSVQVEINYKSSGLESLVRTLHAACMMHGSSRRPSHAKPMIYKIGNCHYLAWQSALLEMGKDWFFQFEDNIFE